MASASARLLDFDVPRSLVNRINRRSRRDPIDIGIAVCAVGFVGVLALSAYWDPGIRILHTFESLPYLATALLCLRKRKFGYALGVASGGFWLWTAGFLTTFIRNGFDRLSMLLHTGSVDRADLLIAAPAAIVTAGLAVLSLIGYMRLSAKSWSDVVPFVSAIGLVAALFVGIFAAFAPQYLGMFHGLLGT